MIRCKVLDKFSCAFHLYHVHVRQVYMGFLKKNWYGVELTLGKRSLYTLFIIIVSESTPDDLPGLLLKRNKNMHEYYKLCVLHPLIARDNTKRLQQAVLLKTKRQPKCYE